MSREVITGPASKVDSVSLGSQGVGNEFSEGSLCSPARPTGRSPTAAQSLVHLPTNVNQVTLVPGLGKFYLETSQPCVTSRNSFCSHPSPGPQACSSENHRVHQPLPNGGCPASRQKCPSPRYTQSWRDRYLLPTSGHGEWVLGIYQMLYFTAEIKRADAHLHASTCRAASTHRTRAQEGLRIGCVYS